MDDQHSLQLQVLLAEYNALRQETVQRISNRAQLLVASLTVSGLIIGLALERNSAPLLLVTPLAACLFGSQVLSETMGVFRIGQYIRDEIEPPLRSVCQDFTGWEGVLRGTLGILPHLPTILSTLLPSLIAGLLAWSYPGPLLTRVILSVVDILAVALFLFEYQHQLIRKTRPTAIPREANAD
jgi:hypothetical protein